MQGSDFISSLSLTRLVLLGVSVVGIFALALIPFLFDSDGKEQAMQILARLFPFGKKKNMEFSYLAYRHGHASNSKHVENEVGQDDGNEGNGYFI